MKTTLVTLFAISGLLSACGGGGGGGSSGPAAFAAPAAVPQAAAPSAPAPKPEACSIVLYGDSVMRGQSAKGALANPPAAEIRRLRPDWLVEDRSISGDSVTLAEKRVMNDPRTARVVVLSWGINDQGFDWDVSGPLGRLVDFIKAEGRTVVITGLSANDNPKTDATNAAEVAVATGHGAAFVSWGERAIVTVDGTHPDQASSNELAGDLVAVLDRECM